MSLECIFQLSPTQKAFKKMLSCTLSPCQGRGAYSVNSGALLLNTAKS